MPPKKKNNKKNDDWESELGETVDPIAAATQAAKDAEVKNDAEEEDSLGGGGLMAAMRKNRNKKKNKGRQVEDFVDGEDPLQTIPEAEAPNLAEKAPEAATMDEEFALPDKKSKGKPVATESPKPDEDEDETGADGRILTKKEKEKLKKEREKQRKKEQVRIARFPLLTLI